MKALLTTLSLATASLALSQLTITTGLDNTTLQGMLGGPGVLVSNVTFTGNASAIGSFTGSSEIPIYQGLVLSSGDVQELAGSASNTAGVPWGQSGYSPLSNATGTPDAMGYDAAVLEFDVIPTGDSMWFNFAFGSEEYPEYVGSAFNDVFAIFISGPGIAGTMNIARLTDGSVVSINSVNNGTSNTGPCANCTYYIDNANGMYVSLDAFTENILVGTAVQPGQVYHFAFAIEDVSDGIMDSGVFIQAFSFKSNGPLAVPVQDELALQLSPNPVSDQLTVRFKTSTGDLRITNAEGKEQMMVNGISNGSTIDIQSLAPGIYFAEMISGDERSLVRFVKR